MRNKKIEEYAHILFFFSIIGAIGIILSALEKPNLWVKGSVIYLLIAFFLYHYSITSDIESKNYEIAQLIQEIRKLESIRDADENIIKLLKQENERLEKHQE